MASQKACPRRTPALRALCVASAVASLAACGGGGGDTPPAPAAQTPAPSGSNELPTVVDAAQRLRLKQALLPLLAGSYGDACSTSNAAGQLLQGGGPLALDANGAHATAAAGSLDLSAPGSSGFQFTRYLNGAMGGTTAVANIAYGGQPNDTAFSLSVSADDPLAPSAFAMLARAGGTQVLAACTGAVPPLASADLFALVRPFMPAAPVRMLQCLSTTDGRADGPAAAGEVRIGLRDITVNGVQVSLDAQGKRDEVVEIIETGTPGWQYSAAWAQLAVQLTLDDAGNVLIAVINDSSTSSRTVSCEKPAG